MRVLRHVCTPMVVRRQPGCVRRHVPVLVWLACLVLRACGADNAGARGVVVMRLTSMLCEGYEGVAPDQSGGVVRTERAAGAVARMALALWGVVTSAVSCVCAPTCD